MRTPARRWIGAVALLLVALAIAATPLSLGCKKDSPTKPGTPCDQVTVYVTNSGSKYHRAGCSYLNQSANAMSLCDAKAKGYGPCSRCDPPE